MDYTPPVRSIRILGGVYPAIAGGSGGGFGGQAGIEHTQAAGAGAGGQHSEGLGTTPRDSSRLGTIPGDSSRHMLRSRSAARLGHTVGAETPPGAPNGL